MSEIKHRTLSEHKSGTWHGVLYHLNVGLLDYLFPVYVFCSFSNFTAGCCNHALDGDEKRLRVGDLHPISHQIFSV